MNPRRSRSRRKKVYKVQIYILISAKSEEEAMEKVRMQANEAFPGRVRHIVWPIEDKTPVAN